jgi:hypothetical protein
MKLIELISEHTWQEVESLYLQHYPKEKRYRKKAKAAFEYIKSLNPVTYDMQICIKYREDFDGNYHDVLARDGTIRPDGREESFDISLVDWDKWLGMEIDSNTLEKYSGLDILCHCFWEMTWHGYSMEMVKQSRDELHHSKSE